MFAVIGQFLEKEFSRMSPKERKKLEKELQEADTGLYVPLPGTTETVESPLYKGSDPEWKAFAKLSRDPKKLSSIKASLAEFAKKAIDSNPSISLHFGKEWKISRAWIDVAYPMRPPPTFQRKALCWDDDGLSIVLEEVDSDIAFKLQRTLMPTAATLSLWSFSTKLAQHHFYTVANYFGFEPKNQQVTSVQETLDRMRQHVIKGTPPKTPGTVSDPTTLSPKPADSSDDKAVSPTRRQTADGSEDSATSRASDNTASDKPAESRFPEAISPFSKSQGTSEKRPSAKDMHGVREVSEHTAGAWQALKKKWKQAWQPKRPYPPRGAVNFNGLVEIVSPKASLVIDVSAWYDPKTNAIDGRTLHLGLRAVKPRQMAPLGR